MHTDTQGTNVVSLIRPRVSDCFTGAASGVRFYGLRATADADPRRLVDAWLAYTADCSVRDLTWAESEEAEAQVQFSPDRPSRLARIAAFARPERPGPPAGTWWVEASVVDALAERIAAREASRRAAA